jgi:hypothetical protein
MNWTRCNCNACETWIRRPSAEGWQQGEDGAWYCPACLDHTIDPRNGDVRCATHWQRPNEEDA